MKSNNNTEVKLSEKQKEVIFLMREGKALYTIFYSAGGSPNVIAGKRVIEPTFSKLSNLGLITFDRSETSKTGLQRSYFKLTELGRTTQL